MKYNWGHVLNGKCLVVDPSIGSAKSVTAYAVIEKGVVTRVGTLDIPRKLKTSPSLLGHKLAALGNITRETFAGQTFDLLAMELLYHTPQENTVMSSFQQLTMSIGALHASLAARYRIVVPPWDWHPLRPQDYVKSDIADVKLMADLLIRDAVRLSGRKTA